MKNIFVKVLIAVALLLSTTAALPFEGASFDGGAPTPTCLPTPANPNCPL